MNKSEAMRQAFYAFEIAVNAGKWVDMKSSRHNDCFEMLIIDEELPQEIKDLDCEIETTIVRQSGVDITEAYTCRFNFDRQL